MSVKVMGKVWDLHLPHQELLVLLAMADHADHEGKNVRPHLDLIAWKTGYSRRQIFRILRALEHHRLLIPLHTRGGRGRVNEYEIHLENGVIKSPYVPPGSNGPVSGQDVGQIKEDILTSNVTEKGDNLTSNTPQTVTIATSKGDISRRARGEGIRKEPKKARARAQRGGERARTKTRAREAPPLIPLAADFGCTEEMQAWAQAHTPSIDLETQHAQFLARYVGTAIRRQDWVVTWRSWMQHAQSDQQQHAPTPEPTLTPLEASLAKIMRQYEEEQTHDRP